MTRHHQNEPVLRQDAPQVPQRVWVRDDANVTMTFNCADDISALPLLESTSMFGWADEGTRAIGRNSTVATVLAGDVASQSRGVLSARRRISSGCCVTMRMVRGLIPPGSVERPSAASQ